METIYLIRASIGKFIKRFDLIIRAALKFAAYFLLFHYVSGIEGFQGTGLLNSMPVHAVLAVVSLLLPNRCGILLAIALGLANIFQITVLGAVVAAVFFLVVYLMTARLFPDHVYMLALVPLCLHFKLYLLFPLIAGMYLGLISLIPMLCGAIMSVMMTLIPEFLKLKMSSNLDEMPQILSDVFKYGFNQVIHNEELIFIVIIFTGVVVLIYLLRRMEVNYGSYIAMGAGTILGIVCLIMGKMTFGISDSYAGMILRALLSLLIVAGVEFMHAALNYEATQKLSFEDEEYQYYVTVIPKITVGKPKREIKTITEVNREIPEETEKKDVLKVNAKVSAPPEPARKSVDSPTIDYHPLEEAREEELPEPQELWENAAPQTDTVQEAPRRVVPEPVKREPSASEAAKPYKTEEDGSLASFFEDE